MLLRILVGVILAYALLVLLAWRFQERMAFPAPRGALPDATELNRLGAQHVELVMRDGTRLAGVYLPPHHASYPVGHSGGRAVAQKHSALLWFSGDGESVGAIWDFRVPWHP